LADAFGEFLDRPGADTYLALRQVIIGSPDFDMFSTGLTRLERLIADGAHAAVPDLVAELMPNWLLSARTHVLLGQSAQARGEADRAAREALMAEACMFGLRSTGDGSADAPFWPIHPADEHDLAEFLGKEVLTQRREDCDGRAFDVLNCAGGTNLWFDITDGVVAMVKRGVGQT
jgi:hypothetical protein